MKKIFFSVLFSLFISGIYSQTTKPFLMPMAKRDTLDFVKLCIIYKQTRQMDSLNKDNVEESQMILQIGNKISKYLNYKKFITDSIIISHAVNGKVDTQSELKASYAHFRGKIGDRSYLFKNYPQSGKIMFREWFGSYVSYEEDTPSFKWKIISDETIDILGYSCQKAITSFRGRTYTAWFAPNIPISNGPWKFCGLPGLILKVEDSKKQFCFEGTSIYPVSWDMPITSIISKSEIKTTREKFNIAKKRSKEDPGSTLKNRGITFPGNESPGSLPYNPIELD